MACGLNKSKTEVNVFKVSSENNLFPLPLGYVSDFEGIFTDSQVKELNSIISRHELVTTNQIAIVTLNSIDPYADIKEYSLDLANYWGVGQKDQNNGVLIAFSTKLKKVRIQNGLGIEEKLTGNEALDIIDNIIIPDFKSKNFFDGIKNGLLRVIDHLEEVEAPVVTEKN
ncbi:MAG: TPM domain-containing protein [Bacteroidota bacterium]|nr:TPM domain-containing protein [Bacteroidota bacterium]